MTLDFHFEIDDSPLFNSDKISQYRKMIGSLNQIITLGKFDNAYATSAMAKFNMQPREDIFQQL